MGCLVNCVAKRFRKGTRLQSHDRLFRRPRSGPKISSTMPTPTTRRAESSRQVLELISTMAMAIGSRRSLAPPPRFTGQAQVAASSTRAIARVHRLVNRSTSRDYKSGRKTDRVQASSYFKIILARLESRAILPGHFTTILTIFPLVMCMPIMVRLPTFTIFSPAMKAIQKAVATMPSTAT